MRNIPFMTGEWYHIYARGIDKRIIFLEDRNYLRFILGLLIFNDEDSKLYNIRRQNVQSLASNTEYITRPLVAIGAWTLMPNHYHVLLKQLSDRGISKFMHKLGTSYTKYFNIKNDRRGRLFESTFNAKHIDSDDYFKYASCYIHLNILDKEFPEWRDGDGVVDIVQAKKLMELYRWSSFRNYCGEEEFSDIIDKEHFLSYFDDTINYPEFVYKLLDDKELVQSLALNIGY